MQFRLHQEDEVIDPRKFVFKALFREPGVEEPEGVDVFRLLDAEGFFQDVTDIMKAVAEPENMDAAGGNLVLGRQISPGR